MPTHPPSPPNYQPSKHLSIIHSMNTQTNFRSYFKSKFYQHLNISRTAESWIQNIFVRVSKCDPCPQFRSPLTVLTSLSACPTQRAQEMLQVTAKTPLSPINKWATISQAEYRACSETVSRTTFDKTSHIQSLSFLRFNSNITVQFHRPSQISN